MLDLASVVIESERIRLIPVSKDFAAAIFHEFSPEITRFMFPKPPEVIEETLNFVQAARLEIDADESLNVVILDKTTGEFFGCGGINHIITSTPELGIWIKAGAHGNKYGREAVTALTAWASEKLRFEYLTYPVDRRNVASRKIPESLGGIVETEYEKTHASGAVLDILEYRLYAQ